MRERFDHHATRNARRRGTPALLAIAALLTAAATSRAEPAPTGEPAPTTAPATMPAVAPVYDFDPSPPVSRLGPIPVFDGLRNEGKPPLGLPFARVTGQLWERDSLVRYQADKNPFLLEPHEDTIRKLARDSQRGGWLLVVNVEAFPLDARRFSDAEVEESTRRLANMFRLMREEAPSLRIGFYGFAPLRDWFVPVRLHRYAKQLREQQTRHPRFDEMTEARGRWRLANERLGFSRRADGSVDPTGFADLLDFVCPSLYLFYKDATPDDARAYVRANIEEARIYGKEVYPFMWPVLHDWSGPVPLVQWTAAVREAASLSDGLILWDSSRTRWTPAIALRVRVARLLAERRGGLTDRQLVEVLRSEFPRSDELDALLAVPDDASAGADEASGAADDAGGAADKADEPATQPATPLDEGETR